MGQALQGRTPSLGAEGEAEPGLVLVRDQLFHSSWASLGVGHLEGGFRSLTLNTNRPSGCFKLYTHYLCCISINPKPPTGSL